MSGQQGSVKKVRIAKIVNTHGVRGEVKAIPLSDFPDRYNSLKEVYIERNNSYCECIVEGIRWSTKFLLIKLKGIENPEEAAFLKDKYLEINREDTIPLPEDTYYFFELVGLKVLDSQGNYLGTIEDILQTSANDVYVVKQEKSKELLIPALKKVVREVDLDNKKMVVELLPGLLDEGVQQ